MFGQILCSLSRLLIHQPVCTKPNKFCDFPYSIFLVASSLKYSISCGVWRFDESSKWVIQSSKRKWPEDISLLLLEPSNPDLRHYFYSLLFSLSLSSSTSSPPSPPLLTPPATSSPPGTLTPVSITPSFLHSRNSSPNLHDPQRPVKIQFQERRRWRMLEN